ncbi:hypothetical protein HYS47_04640 [Candidatus Woesearchaeota archaeon]|nr:hypothetical protein [Candidatus Woesearchaeota archaeon]
MGWLNLHVIDETERRSRTVRGPNWVFHTIQRQPKTIAEFIAIEREHSGYTALEPVLTADEYDRYSRAAQEENRGFSRHILEVLRSTGEHDLAKKVQQLMVEQGIHYDDHEPVSFAVSYSPNSRKDTARSPDNGGTLLVDLRKRVITIKGHPIRSLDEATYGASADEIKKTRGGVIHVSTGEQYYRDYGLISRLWDGKVHYAHAEVGIKMDPKLFNPAGIYDERHSRRPTKARPNIRYLVDRRERGVVFAKKMTRWEAVYHIPDTWQLRDGIHHLQYLHP